MNALLLTGAVGATVAAAVHGGVGHRWLVQQLRAVTLPASSLFGDADVGRRVLLVSWHVVTAVFAVTAAALLLMAFGAFGSRPLLVFLSALHVTFLLVGLLLFWKRLDAWTRPIPPVFATSMGTVALTTWLASRA